MCQTWRREETQTCLCEKHGAVTKRYMVIFGLSDYQSYSIIIIIIIIIIILLLLLLLKDDEAAERWLSHWSKKKKYVYVF